MKIPLLFFFFSLTTLLLSVATSAQETLESENNDDDLPPSQIKLRVGLLHAPPFAILDERYDGEPYYHGFQVDLMEKLQEFAWEMDSVDLQFNISRSPPQYDDALTTVAKDCKEKLAVDSECDKFDLIVGDYYSNPERSLRVDFTPPFLRTTISTLCTVQEETHDNNNLRRNHHYNNLRRTQQITTLSQAQDVNATVCVPDGTYLMKVIMGKYPDATYYKCPSPDDCLDKLKSKQCVLYADDELLLRHRATQDPELQMTRETYNTQYLVWPMRRDLPEAVRIYFKRWMYAAVANATLDDLYHEYFDHPLCPVGTAGADCELPCDPVHGTADAAGKCVCESPKWTGVDCSVEVPEDKHMIPPTLKALSMVMLAINYAFILLCGGWLFWKRESAQVKVSQPFFLALVLVGCFISTSTIIAMNQESEGDGPVHACMAIPWLYSFGFSITYGSMFAKIRRVYKIFQYRASAARNGVVATRSNPRIGRRVLITSEFMDTFCIILLVLAVDCVILVWWTIMSPLKWRRVVVLEDQFGVPLESIGACTSEHWEAFAAGLLAFHVLLMGFGCYICYVTRKIPTRFQEGKALSRAMILNLQIFLVGVPLMFVLNSPKSTFFLRSIMIAMNDFVVLALIFGNLIYSFHFQSDGNEPGAVKAAIGEAVQQYAMNERKRSGERKSPKGSQTSGTSRTPPAAQLQSQESILSESENRESQQNQEIVLTLSAFEVSNGDESSRQAPASEVSSQSKPLPRYMMNSSVSTIVHGNLGGMASISENVPVNSELELHPRDPLSDRGSTATVSRLPPRPPRLPNSSTASSNPSGVSNSSTASSALNMLSGFSAASSNFYNSTASTCSEHEPDSNRQSVDSKPRLPGTSGYRRTWLPFGGGSKSSTNNESSSKSSTPSSDSSSTAKKKNTSTPPRSKEPSETTDSNAGSNEQQLKEGPRPFVPPPPPVGGSDDTQRRTSDTQPPPQTPRAMPNLSDVWT